MREDPFTLSHFGSYDCQSALTTITFHSCLFSLASSAPSLNVLLVRLPSPFPVLKSRGRDLEPSVSPQSLRQNIAHRRGRSEHSTKFADARDLVVRDGQAEGGFRKHSYEIDV
jgi:hypothetical protein